MRDHHGQVERAIEGDELAEQQDDVHHTHHDQAVAVRLPKERFEPAGRMRAARGKEDIDRELDDIGLQEGEDRVQRHQRDGQPKQPSIGAHVSPHPSQQPGVIGAPDFFLCLNPHGNQPLAQSSSIAGQLLFEQLPAE
jgi:hypothetical protein